MDPVKEVWLYTEFSPIYGVSGARKIINQLKQLEQWTYEYAKGKDQPRN